MKKYLLVFLYTFIVFSSFANSQAEQQPEETPADMDSSFADLQKRGMTAERFIALLENPPWLTHYRIFSWINELLEQNDPDIDKHLVRLLATDYWLKSSDQEDVSRWMGTLIMREFANDNEVIAMFEEEPWKSHFASHMVTSTTLTKLINEDRTRTFLRQAVGNAISSFLPTRASQFVNNPKLFTWTVTILTTWEYDPSDWDRITNFFKSAYKHKPTWKTFDDFDRLTEILLTRRGIASLLERLNLLRAVLHNTINTRRPNQILIAVEQNQKNIEEGREPPYDRQVTQKLIDLVWNYTFQWNRFGSIDISEDNLEALFRAIDILIDSSDKTPEPTGNVKHKERRNKDDRFVNILKHLAKVFGFNDPRIETRIDRILERSNLDASDIISILHNPLWRERPYAPDLMIKLIQQPNQFYKDWEKEEVNEEINRLLEYPFWQNHPRLKNQLGREQRRWAWLINPPFREVTLNNIRSCRVALTN